MHSYKLFTPLLLTLVLGCTQRVPEPDESAPARSASSSSTTEKEAAEDKTKESPSALTDSAADLTDTVPSEAEMAACMKGKQNTLEKVARLLARHQPGCSSDDECILVDPSIPCQSNCQMAVSARSAQGFTRSLEELGQAACSTASKQCGIEGLCPEITGARCVAGTCRPVITDLAAPSPAED